MVTQVVADEELERLRGFPEIGREELFWFFTLAPSDVAFVDPGRGRGPADRLGLSVALCTLPWLGFVPDDVGAALAWVKSEGRAPPTSPTFITGGFVSPSPVGPRVSVPRPRYRLGKGRNQ